MIRFAALPLAVAVTAAPLLAQTTLTPADQAAGFKLVGTQWQACGDSGTASYSPGAIESVADVNGGVEA